MSNFSFTSFLNNNGASNNGNGGGYRGNTALSKPTPNQVRFYNDLCERKRITPKSINSFTFDQLAKEIEEMRKMPDPASQRQIDKIRELEKEIIELGGDLKPISQAVLNSLTGGREGTASSLIQSLFDMRTNMNEVAPPSDAQVQIIVEWFLCPAINFEQFGITKRVYLDHLNSYSTDVDSPDVLEKRLWRSVTPTEFAEQIKKKMTKKEASRFIDDNRGTFYEWRKTRITSQQVNYIRELEKRLSNIETPKQVEWAVVDGEIVQITNTKHKGEYYAEGYTPFSDMQLAQMSYEEASEWIDRLKYEISLKNSGYQSMHNEEEVYGDNQQNFEDNRKAKNEHDARTEEFNKLNDLIFALEAILGYEDMDAHNAVQEIILDGVDSRQALAHKSYLKNFFMNTVTADRNKDEDAWTQQMARIFNMCEEVPTALEILATDYDALAS